MGACARACLCLRLCVCAFVCLSLCKGREVAEGLDGWQRERTTSSTQSLADKLHHPLYLPLFLCHSHLLIIFLSFSNISAPNPPSRHLILRAQISQLLLVHFVLLLYLNRQLSCFQHLYTKPRPVLRV